MANIYEAYEPLAEKWKDYTKVVESHMSNFNHMEEVQLSILLENTAQSIQSYKDKMLHDVQNSGGFITEGTDVSMVNTFTSNVFDIITAVMPNLIANDIVSVQPLDRRNGMVFFLKFTYANNKGGIKAGDNMLTSQQGFSGADYSGEHVSGEVLDITGNAVNHTVLHTPIKPGTVVLTTADDISKELRDVPNADGVTGTFTDAQKTGLGSGTIDYVKGTLTLTGVTVKEIELAFDYDLNSFNAPVDALDVRVVSEPVVARPRKLKSVNIYAA